MDKTVQDKLNVLIAAYDQLIRGIENAAAMQQDRAYGGIVRAGKGKLVENTYTEEKAIP